MLASCQNDFRDRTDDRSLLTGALAARDPEVIAATSRILGPVADRVFRYEFRGLDSIPPSPCLLVGNHSGGGVVEVPCILVKWHQRFGERRPGYGLTNVLSLGYPIIGNWLRAIGGVDASHDNARACLAAGRDTLVFPGGDIDSFRPFHQTRRVEFGRRRGYIRLALEMKVPIVPLATIGSHLTYWMLPGNRWIADKLGLKRSSVRLESVPLTFGAVAAAAASGAAAFDLLHPGFAALAVGCGLLPFPSRITTEALPAIDLSRELPESMDPEERVERGHRIVISALERALRTMRHGRPLPARARHSGEEGDPASWPEEPAASLRREVPAVWVRRPAGGGWPHVDGVDGEHAGDLPAGAGPQPRGERIPPGRPGSARVAGARPGEAPGVHGTQDHRADL